MTASLSVYAIAEAVVLVVKDGNTIIPFELTKKEALDIAGGIAVAIHRIGSGQSVAPDMAEFMAGLED